MSLGSADVLSITYFPGVDCRLPNVLNRIGSSDEETVEVPFSESHPVGVKTQSKRGNQWKHNFFPSNESLAGKISSSTAVHIDKWVKHPVSWKSQLAMWRFKFWSPFDKVESTINIVSKAFWKITSETKELNYRQRTNYNGRLCF